AMAALALREPRMVGIARTLNRDGWGRPWMFTQAEGDAGRQLLSYGSDGMPAGEKHAADIAVDIDPEPAETGGDGIQQTMAESLGLMFQLDGLPYGTPSWIPGDMSIDEIGAAFKERGQRIEDLTDLLDGKGLFGGLIRGIFGVIPTLDAMFGGRVVDTMHVMLIETLGNESTIEVALAMQGPAFKEVLLDMRNERAMDVMDAKIQDAPSMESIAVLYGAGHLSGLTELLGKRGEYEVVDERWLPAITLELDNSALTRTEIDMLRGWVGVIGRQLHKGSGGGGPE
ncbi:MAG: type II secretion system protein GspG, partial [Phycisphaerales bacterium]|nr:type II secretion system protein GspG [Phycisphaerales bacterium]